MTSLVQCVPRYTLEMPTSNIRITDTAGMDIRRYLFVILVAARYATNPHITIQDLIWSGRFYDQAHFIHEFQKVTSCSPMEFYRFFKKRDEWL